MNITYYVVAATDKKTLEKKTFVVEFNGIIKEDARNPEDIATAAVEKGCNVSHCSFYSFGITGQESQRIIGVIVRRTGAKTQWDLEIDLTHRITKYD